MQITMLPDSFISKIGIFFKCKKRREDVKLDTQHKLMEVKISVTCPTQQSSLTVFIKCCRDVNAFDKVIPVLGTQPKGKVRNAHKYNYNTRLLETILSIQQWGIDSVRHENICNIPLRMVVLFGKIMIGNVCYKNVCKMM